MSSIITSIIAEKGGVGKSTWGAHMSQILGYSFDLNNKPRVLVIDLDKQGDCSAFLNLESPTEVSIVSLFTGKCQIEEFADKGIVKSGNSNVDVIEGSHKLASLMEHFYPKPVKEVYNAIGVAFQRLINYVSSKYDYIFVDFAPGVDEMYLPILSISNAVVVPTTTDLLSMKSSIRFKGLLENKYKVNTENIFILPSMVTNSVRAQKDVKSLDDFFTTCEIIPKGVHQSIFLQRVLEGEQNLFVRWFENKKVKPVIEAFLDFADELYGANKSVIIENIKKDRIEYLNSFKIKRG